MARRCKTRVTLDIVWNPDEVGPPQRWDWDTLIDSERGQVTVHEWDGAAGPEDAEVYQPVDCDPWRQQ